ncbi:hypothetical protein BKA25_005364 [Actinoalloteichus hymeniacidonis]|uniref:DUF2191 domain-containing protein n=1 Tax=Actinoalloteichus hymeniacidonis TaxID=340345 RepID=A0AAC9HLH0_9PSEU|nr:hypothetical protein TL08_00515 [Actinoalloteichus hymeniacidonis]MBB5911048.1 hypothetical protein [Actinoalloteichus hymeniacidonis]
MLVVTDIDDVALAEARRRLGTSTADETVNAALRLVAGLPPDRGGTGEPGLHLVRLAEDILDQQADGIP